MIYCNTFESTPNANRVFHINQLKKTKNVCGGKSHNRVQIVLTKFQLVNVKIVRIHQSNVVVVSKIISENRNCLRARIV